MGIEPFLINFCLRAIIGITFSFVLLSNKYRTVKYPFAITVRRNYECALAPLHYYVNEQQRPFGGPEGDRDRFPGRDRDRFPDRDRDRFPDRGRNVDSDK